MVPEEISLLIIEDDEDDYMLTREIIEGMEGVHVRLDWVAGFADAKHMMLTGGYNICLLDYRLGEGNGIDLLKSAREKGHHAPVIILTGQGDHEIDMAAMAAGAADYLVKGELNPPMLERSIRYALNMGEKVAELEKANDRLKELDRIKTELVSNVSHELRTPLTSIKSFTEILLDEVDHLDVEEARRYLQIMNREADRLARLISDFLDIRKIEEGKSSWHDDLLDMAALCHQVVEQYRSAASRKDVSLFNEISEGACMVRADWDRIMQVLSNIISNAIKFSAPKGKVIVSLEKGARLCPTGGVSVMVSVSDNGPGISLKEQLFIFERFHQAGNVDGVKPAGTGLGLAICKEIVEHYGGKIWVESNPGSGSTFSFTIPCAVQQPERGDAQ